MLAPSFVECQRSRRIQERHDGVWLKLPSMIARCAQCIRCVPAFSSGCLKNEDSLRSAFHVIELFGIHELYKQKGHVPNIHMNQPQVWLTFGRRQQSRKPRLLQLKNKFKKKGGVVFWVCFFRGSTFRPHPLRGTATDTHYNMRFTDMILDARSQRLHIMLSSRDVLSKSFATPQTDLPGSSVHEISQTKILERVAISFSRGSSPPRD